MKAYKVLTITTIVILVAILGVAAFGGIYKLQNYKVRNVIPKYLLGKEFSKSRSVELTVDDSASSTKIYDKDGNEVVEQEEGIEYTEENGYTIVEEKVNPQEALTQENYKKAKKIIANRLHDLGVDQYNIKLDKETGKIDLDITEDDKTDEVISVLTTNGKFELVDSDTQEVLLDNSVIKSAKVVYGQVDAQNTVVYLQIKFNKEGAKKLEEISKIYIETVEQVENEEGEMEEQTNDKNISILLDGQEIRTTHFGDSLTTGILNVPIGSATDSDSLKTYVTSAGEMVIILNRGVMPITYTQTNHVQDNTKDIYNNKIIIFVLIGIALIAIAYLVIRLKLNGLLATILEIGYISLLLLVLRYTNIKITLTGLIGIAISIILNYIYIYIAFKNKELNFVKELTAKYAIKLIPFYVIAIVFTFFTSANISSIGMTLFWGILIMYLYNLSLTQITTKIIKD